MKIAAYNNTIRQTNCQKKQNISFKRFDAYQNSVREKIYSLLDFADKERELYKKYIPDNIAQYSIDFPGKVLSSDKSSDTYSIQLERIYSEYTNGEKTKKISCNLSNDIDSISEHIKKDDKDYVIKMEYSFGTESDCKKITCKERSNGNEYIITSQGRILTYTNPLYPNLNSDIYQSELPGFYHLYDSIVQTHSDMFKNANGIESSPEDKSQNILNKGYAESLKYLVQRSSLPVRELSDMLISADRMSQTYLKAITNIEKYDQKVKSGDSFTRSDLVAIHPDKYETIKGVFPAVFGDISKLASTVSGRMRRQ